jgi:hypothetical protein
MVTMVSEEILIVNNLDLRFHDAQGHEAHRP